jgi:hypothetical protein
MQARALGTGFLSDPGLMDLGVYARQMIDIKDLPARWHAGVVTSEGWVLAAWANDRPQVAILCRPDSVQSMKGDAGKRLLRAALDWVADWKS